MTSSVHNDIGSLTSRRDLAALRDALVAPVQRVTLGARASGEPADPGARTDTERVDAHAPGMSVEVRNANDGIGLVQTVDGALGNVAAALGRMRELATASARVELDAVDRHALDRQFGSLTEQVRQTLGQASFGGQRVLGADAGTQNFQVSTSPPVAGPVALTTRDLESAAEISALTGSAAAGTGRARIDSVSASGAAIERIDAARAVVDGERAATNKLREHFDTIVSNPRVWLARLAEDRDRLLDAPQAADTAGQTRTTILRDSGTALAAQAVPLTQSMLSMLNDA